MTRSLESSRHRLARAITFRLQRWHLSLAAAVAVAWWPVETRPVMAPVLAGAALASVLWGWESGHHRLARRMALSAAVVLLTLGLAALTGLDPARGLARAGLIAAAVAVGLGARLSDPPADAPRWLGLGIGALALWAGWQTAVGFDHLAPWVAELDGAQRSYVEARLATRRAFASQLVPGHLGVLLVTATPLLLEAARHNRRRWLAAGVLTVAGAITTRSPLALALLLPAVGWPVIRSTGRKVVSFVAALVVIAVVAVALTRPDMASAEPIERRWDNWRTAWWTWQTAPAAGVGLGGYYLGSRGAPVDPGNRPLHAHSLPLEMLAELGPIGGAGATGILVMAVALAWRIRHRRPWLAGALLVIPAHAVVDFSWAVSGVLIPWAVLAGWSATAPRPDSPGSSDAARWDPVRLATTVAGVVLVALALLHATSRAMDASVSAEPSSVNRLTVLERSARLAPWRIEPALAAAEVATRAPDRVAIQRVSELLESRVWLRPTSPAVGHLLSRLAARGGDPIGAAAAAWPATDAGATARTSHP